MDALPDAEERRVRKDGLVAAGLSSGRAGSRPGVVAAGAVLPPLLVADGIDVVLERLCAARVERVEHGRAADGAVDERVHAVGCVVRGPSGLVAAALGETVEDRGREDVPRVWVRDHRLLLLLCLLLPWGWGG